MRPLYYNIYNDWLVSTDELNHLRDIYSDFCQSAHKSNNQHTACQLWHSLTGSSTRKNSYYMPMPFLMRAVFDSNKDKQNCSVLKLPDCWFPELLPPSKQIDAVFLLSTSMCIEIRDRFIEDTCKSELWDIPRDFSVLAVPAKRCHVRLFLRDLRYVSDMESDTEKDWLKELKLPITRTWNGFKSEFMQTFWAL
jgi:hypothetical protein